MPRLSLIVIARNEAASIATCLRSASFADEIVLVDNGSTDNTVEIARGLGAKVILAPDWPGFGAQKNRALDAATGDWILSLDADEWIEAPLAAEIRAVIAAPENLDGYEIPRRSRFCGEIVRHAGWWPDYVLRFFRRSAARFSDDPVHEKLLLTGTLGKLVQPIEHDSITDLDDAHDKIGRYAAAAAAQLAARGKKSSIPGAVGRAIVAFFKSYVIRLGFLDGSTGLMVAAYQNFYIYEKWARLAVLNRNARRRNGGPNRV